MFFNFTSSDSSNLIEIVLMKLIILGVLPYQLNITSDFFFRLLHFNKRKQFTFKYIHISYFLQLPYSFFYFVN